MEVVHAFDLRAVMNTASATRAVSESRRSAEHGLKVLFIGFMKMKDLLASLRRLKETERVLDEST